jgi:hypothetical protein
MGIVLAHVADAGAINVAVLWRIQFTAVGKRVKDTDLTTSSQYL